MKKTVNNTTLVVFFNVRRKFLYADNEKMNKGRQGKLSVTTALFFVARAYYFPSDNIITEIWRKYHLPDQY